VLTNLWVVGAEVTLYGQPWVMTADGLEPVGAN
jgi:hypothetical protein